MGMMNPMMMVSRREALSACSLCIAIVFFDLGFGDDVPMLKPIGRDGRNGHDEPYDDGHGRYGRLREHLSLFFQLCQSGVRKLTRM